MRIDSSYVGMESARRFTSVTRQTTSLQNFATMYMPSLGVGAEQSRAFTGKGTTNQNSTNASYMGLGTSYNSVSASMRISSVQDVRARESIRRQCMEYLIGWLYDNIYSKRKDLSFGNGENPLESLQSQVQAMQQKEANVSAFVNNIQPNMQYYYQEEEQTAFSTQGIVRTKDGRQINFNLDFMMSRGFEQYYEQRYEKKITPMRDPLVINLDGNLTSLSDQKFKFDIDGDGILESISQLGKGSGYIALDKNGDGIINDGTELFGTESGNGFADLARYDSDGDGWIDEDDEIWKKLLIWTKDENGNDKLYHLYEKGVGAICLQQVQTDFSLNSLRTNQVNGQIRQSGIFLYENGMVGTMQNIDVAN